MAYVDGLLVSGETVVRREQQHWILPFYIAGRWVGLAAGVFAAAFIVNFVLPDGGDGFIGGLLALLNGLLLVVTIVGLVIAAGGFAWSVARWKAQEYVLTSQRVVHVEGVITKRSSDSVLESLIDAQIEVPLLGRMLGWGNLVLMTANEAGNASMLAVRDPIGFKKAVMEAKAARTAALNQLSRPPAYAAGSPALAASPVASPPYPPPLAASPPSSPSPAASPSPVRSSGEEVTRTLTALAGLRDAGAITADEYEAKKKELLDRI